MSAPEVLKPFRACCNAITGYERFGDEDEPMRPVECLLPPGHDGPHADWTAWIGVSRPNFDVAGRSLPPEPERPLSREDVQERCP